MAELTKKTVKIIYGRDNGICQLCFSPVGEFYTEKRDWDIDHIVPQSFGGQNYLKNLRLTHKACNNNRSDDLTNEEKNKRLSDQYELQNGKCYLCHEPLKFSMVNKIAPEYRFPVSWTNMALVHKACRVQYNSTIVQNWNNQMKKMRNHTYN